MTPDSLAAIGHTPESFRAACRKTQLDIRRAGEKQALALMAAGWTIDFAGNAATEPWQLYWRRPPRRKDSRGRRYLSTQQAYNALMREKGDGT